MSSPLELRLGECLPCGTIPKARDGRSWEFSRAPLLVSLFFCLICISCGAVGSGQAPAPPSLPPVSVTVAPTSAQPFPGERVQFSATVQNAASTAVTWQVNGVPGGNLTLGIIDSTGKYTAPALVPNQPSVTITAVLQSDSTKTGSASVNIQSLSSIQGPLTLSPKLSSVTTSQALQLNVLTAHVSNSDVNWAVDGAANGNPAVGTISPSGAYSPPSAAGSHLITAILIANTNSFGSAMVEVTDFPGMWTWRNDNSRSGVNGQELVLSPGPGPGAVSSATFGKLFACPADGPLDGYVYAQPLYVSNLAIGNETHNVVFVATEKDSVYAFDADANPCKQLWKVSLVPTGTGPIAFPNLQIKGTDIVPFVGITGTPVIDLTAAALYVVAATQTIELNPGYSHVLYALDLATGSTIRVAGVGVDPLDSAFNSSVENQQSALLLDNGTVYVAFGSYGGQCTGQAECQYHGWLFGHDSASLTQTGLLNFTPSGIKGGILQSGGGPSADLNHNVFVATGDGTFNTSRPGVSNSYSNSFLRLGTTGGLSVSDYFTPCDEGTGQIVGNGAPVLLPPIPSQPNLLIGGSNGVSSGGSLYVMNRDNMGRFLPSPCPDLSIRVQTVPVSGPVLSTPLFWNGNVYVAPGNGNLQAFSMTNGNLASTPASQSPEQLGPQGATPVISWNGTNNGTAILWLIDASGALASMPAVLRAFDPNDLSKDLYNSATVTPRDTAGPAVKFTVPTVANGKVYVGTQTELDVYGLLQ
jgi:hypothetical protein